MALKKATYIKTVKMTVDEVYATILTLVDKTDNDTIDSMTLLVKEFPKVKKGDVIEVSVGIDIMPE